MSAVNIIREKIVATTAAQRQIFADCQAGDERSAAYHDSLLLELRGPLDREAMREAMFGLVRRRDNLRISFDRSGEELIAHEDVPLNAKYLRCDAKDHLADRHVLAAYRDEVYRHISQPFDLLNGPLYRFGLFRLAEDRHLLLLTYHHLISDGWSMQLCLSDLEELYSARVERRRPNLPEVLGVEAYADWWEESKDSSAMAEKRRFWLAQYERLVPALRLPVASRNRKPSSKGDGFEITVPPEIRKELERIGAAQNCTLMIVLFAAYSAFLARICNQREFAIGVATSGRSFKGGESVAGFCSSVMPVRCDVDTSLDFASHLGRVKSWYLDARENEEYPYSAILADVSAELGYDKETFVRAGFSFNSYFRKPAFAGLQSSFLPVRKQHAFRDISFHVSVGDESIYILCNYKSDLFSTKQIENLAAGFDTFLKGIVDGVEEPLWRLGVVREAEKALQTREWIRSERPRPGKPVHRLFEDQAERTPDRCALKFEEVALSYETVNRRANRLAHVLIERGVGIGEPVAVCLERSPELIISLLAILKAGAAYVPVDPAYPQERIERMLDDAGADLLLTDRDNAQRFPAFAGQVLCVSGQDAADGFASAPETNPDREVGPDDLAYVIYTSGSSGTPKGVAVTHKGITRLVVDPNYIELSDHDVILHHASVSFDAATFEIWAPLLNGGQLVLFQGKGSDIDALAACIEAQGVNILCLTAGLLPAWVARHKESQLGLDYALVGGDVVSEASVHEWYASDDRVTVLNCYGPTENTLFSTTYTVPRDRAATGVLPIGRPVSNTRVYVLDENRQLLPAGSEGELHVAGDGLAREYLGAPELTAERFIVADVAGTRERLYRTGDRVRWLPDGNLEFIGRIDDQVKVRGFRVEPGEVEAWLARHDRVKSCLVTVGGEDSASKRLVAYVVEADERAGQPDLTQALTAHLRAHLPDYMIPSAFVRLDAFPVTINGKIDREALPPPDDDAIVHRDYAAPETETQRLICGVWSEVLQLERLGIKDNFFELGGDSILAIVVANKLQVLGLDVSTEQILSHQTIAELAARIGERDAGDETPTAIVHERRVTLTPVQRRFFAIDGADVNHFNQSFLLHAPDALDGTFCTAFLKALFDAHDVFQTRFRCENGSWAAVHHDAGLHDFHAMVEEHTIGKLDADDPGGDFAAIAGAAQQSLDIENGPMVKLVIVRGAERGDVHLLLVIHHLVVDPVSWHAILADLEVAYDQWQSRRPIALRPGTCPYHRWSRHLGELANDPKVLAQKAYWSSVLDAGRGGEHGTDEIVATGALESLEIALPERAANAVQSPKRLDKDLAALELYLACLSIAVNRWQGADRACVMLESHGRVPLGPDLDPSRSVGWFTSLYPFSLHAPEAPAPYGRRALHALVDDVKRRYRAVPTQGIGYGVLRHLLEDEELRRKEERGRPRITFNFLGKVDRYLDQGTLFRQCRDRSGVPSVSPSRRAAFDVGLVSYVVGDRLHLRAEYDSGRYGKGDAEALLAEIASAFDSICDALGPDASPESHGREAAGRPADENVAELRRRYPDVIDAYPTTGMQFGMLFQDSIDRDKATYTSQFELTLKGPLDVDAFKRAWRRLAALHDPFRTAFIGFGHDELQQVVVADVQHEWHVEDLSRLSAPEARRLIDVYCREDKARGFDVSKPPLMRFALFALGDLTVRFVWTLHHALLDGWSLPVVFGQLFKLYAGEVSGAGDRIAPDVVPYKRYIEWLTSRDHEEAREYWRSELRGLPDSRKVCYGELPGEDSERGEATLALSESETAALNAFIRKNRVTLNTLVQAAWSYLQYRYSGSEQVVFGSTVSGRHAEVEGITGIVGMLMNTIPVVTRVDRRQTVGEWLRSLRRKQTERERYSFLPLHEVVHCARVSPGERLFDSLVVFENYPSIALFNQRIVDAAAGVSVEAFEVAEQTDFGLCLQILPGTELVARLLYAAEKYDRATIDRILRNFRHVLAELTADADRCVDELPFPCRDECVLLTDEWSGRAAETHPAELIHEAFSRQARSTPDAAAVRYRGESRSYRELDEKSDRLAGGLRGFGIGKGDLVAFALSRSPDLIASMLAILKAGAAYVPLDVRDPPERLVRMLDRLGVKVLLTDLELPAALAAAKADVCSVQRLLSGDDDAARHGAALPEMSDGDCAYVIFTSGSTGEPKASAIPHRGVVRLVRDQNYADLDASTVTLHHSNIAFDAATFEIWAPLLNGGTVVLFDGDSADYRVVAAQTVGEKINTLWLTAGALGPWTESVDLDALHLKHLLVGGDVVSPTHVREVYERNATIEVINGYGPTENTTFSCCHRIPRDLAGGRSIPIGKPIRCTSAYVLDEEMRLLPVGAAGELFLGGDGLSTGYVGDAKLNAVRFVVDPFDPRGGGRLYRTGDLVRWLSDGTLEFLGRIDHQIKINGHRVEPAEIELTIAGFPAVEEAAVVIGQTAAGVKRIGACVVLRDEAKATPDETLRNLTAHLRAKLPEYMAPSAAVVLERLPLTVNGKVDRAALPDPWQERSSDIEHLVEPATDTEIALAHIWASLLRVERLSCTDNFFAKGGDSLLLTRLANRIQQAFGLSLELKELFAHPVLGQQAAYIDGRSRGTMANAGRERITRQSGRSRYELSFPQRRLWLLSRIEAGSGRSAYDISAAFALEGELDVAALNRAFRCVVERQWALRTVFEEDGGRPYQEIRAADDFAILELDFSDLEGLEQEARVEALCRDDSLRPFDLESDYPLRVTLVKKAAMSYVAIVTMHHIVADGWSMGVLFRELNAFYDAAVGGNGRLPDPLPIQYVDFAQWQTEQAADGKLEAGIDWWRETLAGLPELHNLPVDRPHRRERSFAGAHVKTTVGPEALRGIKKLAERHDATLFMVLQALFSIFLHKYSGDREVVMGTPVAARNDGDLEQLIGFFTNNVVLRTHIDPGSTFGQCIEAAKPKILDAFDHQAVPFDLLVERLRPNRDPGYNPLFQIMFVLQNNVIDPLALPGVRARMLDYEYAVSKFDLTLAGIEAGDGLELNWEYATDLFDASTIERMAENFVALIEQVVADPERTVAELRAMSEREYRKVVDEWNRSASDYPRDKCIHELVEARARDFPDAVALVHGRDAMTYGELNRNANRLARYLISRNVGRGSKVVIFVDRSFDMIIAVLATLKAGAAYVPVDIDTPEERLKHIVSDAKAALLITERHKLGDGDAPAAPLLHLRTEAGELLGGELSGWPEDDTPVSAADVTPADLAYVIYTSGTSGIPKGTLLPHRGLVNLAYHHSRQFGLGPRGKVLQFASFSFDAATWDWTLALCSGAELHLLSRELAKSPDALGAYVRTRGITYAFIPPALLESLDIDDFRSVETMTVGGEAGALDTLKRWAESRTLYNAYGPTENTVVATMSRIGADVRTLRIGSPIANVACLVLDENGQPVPIGVRGELHLSGVGLADGYLGNETLTAEKFVPNPFGVGDDRLYKTGDVVRWNADGELEFLGRTDDQVKIRGYRIELDEIRSRLLAIDGVRDAAVLVSRADRNRLNAYLVVEEDAAAGGKEAFVADAKQRLRRFLPEYMIPSSYTLLDSLPVTSRGKLDKDRLPMLESERVSEQEFVAPRTALEERLVEIWAEVLGVDRVGVLDNFFDRGGNSLSIIQLQRKLEEALGIEVHPLDLFTYPNISAFLKHLESGEGRTDDTVVDRATDGALETQDIAIIAMTGRFPGADDIDQYWHNIINGIEARETIRDEELLARGVEPKKLTDPSYVKSRMAFRGATLFDNEFFDVNPATAELTDPQNRLMFEGAYRALESAGYPHERDGRRIGIFVGKGSGSLWMRRILPKLSKDSQADVMSAITYTEKDFVATQLAYKLNLTGPAVSINTACSTSLVAVCEACNNLVLGMCEIALAGGVSYSDYAENGYQYQAGFINSPDGHCRPFDIGANGTVPGSGIGLVVLKPLQAALRDGDTVHAVIKGWGCSNDGSDKVGFSAPGVKGQAKAIIEALRRGNVDPASINYIEAHGTGTPMGDPIEIEAIHQAFSAVADQPLPANHCAIGSVKANIGHLDTAAGVAGLIKAVLMLKHRKLPPSVNFEAYNPYLNIERTPLFVNRSEADWIADGPRRAGVSSFGIGGTNAHVILEEAPAPAPRDDAEPCLGGYVIPLSARSKEALRELEHDLLRHLERGGSETLADIARTLQLGRNQHRYRRSWVCASKQELIERLREDLGLTTNDAAFVGEPALGGCNAVEDVGGSADRRPEPDRSAA